MTVRYNSEDQFYTGDGNIDGAFHHHNERMRMFYDTHPAKFEKAVMSSAASVFQRNADNCRVALTVSETGGSATPLGNADWFSLVPVWRMALRRFSLN